MATVVGSPPDIFPGVTLENVDWETYCRLRDEEANNHVRMTYLDGTLTLMSPQIRHDFSSRHFLYVITAVARAWRVPFMPVGATTLKRKGRTKRKGAGKEPDEGFYFGEDAAKVEGIADLDLAIHPPPNLAIEVDNTGESEQSLPTYARIKVPEVWIYKVDEGTIRFVRLSGKDYKDVDRSVVLPRLTTDSVLRAIRARDDRNELDWLDWLDAWARALPEPA